MFDPLCRKLIHAIDNAHNDCVNCVRYVIAVKALCSSSEGIEGDCAGSGQTIRVT